jgi:hypothetical protein
MPSKHLEKQGTDAGGNDQGPEMVRLEHRGDLGQI